MSTTPARKPEGFEGQAGKQQKKTSVCVLNKCPQEWHVEFVKFHIDDEIGKYRARYSCMCGRLKKTVSGLLDTFEEAEKFSKIMSLIS